MSKPHHDETQKERQRGHAGPGDPGSEPTRANVADPVHNQQLHYWRTAGGDVGHQRYVLVSGLQVGVEDAGALYEADAFDTRPAVAVSHSDGDDPSRQAAVFNTAGLHAEKLTLWLGEII